MKKSIVILCTFTSIAFACFCTTDIMQGFNSLKNYIIDDMLTPQRKNADNLQSLLQDRTQELKNQNIEIQKLIAIEKSKALQASKIIFLLTQKRKTLE